MATGIQNSEAVVGEHSAPIGGMSDADLIGRDEDPPSPPSHAPRSPVPLPHHAANN